jgi:predicted ABC-type ATPase
MQPAPARLVIITGPNGVETTTFVRSFLPAVGIRDSSPPT